MPLAPARMPALLERLQRYLAAPGESHERAWKRHARHRGKAQRLDRFEQRTISEGRARARVEKVYRHLLRLQFLQRGEKVDAIRDRLAHADDAAAAQLELLPLDAQTSLPALVVAVRGADLRKVAAARSPGCD